jgi:hypothetical protein
MTSDSRWPDVFGRHEAYRRQPDSLSEWEPRIDRNGTSSMSIDNPQELARQALESLRQEAAKNRGDMTDEQVQEYVDKVIHEFRADERALLAALPTSDD